MGARYVDPGKKEQRALGGWHQSRRAGYMAVQGGRSFLLVGSEGFGAVAERKKKGKEGGEHVR